MIRRLQNNRLVRGSVVMLSGSILANFLAYVFHLLIGRMVSVETYGEFQALNSLINIAMVPSMTIAMVATKFSAQSKAEDDPAKSARLFRYLYAKIFKFGLPLLILALLVTPLVSQYLKLSHWVAVVLVWLIMFLSFLSSVNSGLLTGWQKFANVSRSAVIGNAMKILAGVGLVWVGAGLNGIIGATLIGFLTTYLVMFATLKFVFSASKKDGSDVIDFRAVKDFIWPVLAGNLAMNILANADMILAKHSLDVTASGQYGALLITAKIIYFVLGVIPSVLFAMSSESHHKKDDTRKLFWSAAGLMAVGSLVAAGVYAFMPQLVLGLLFGTKYASVSGYLVWFAAAAILFSFVNLLFQYLFSIHRTRSAYGFLAASLFMVVMIVLKGKDLQNIVILATFSQLLAVAVGLFYLFMRRKTGPNVKEDFDYNPGL